MTFFDGSCSAMLYAVVIPAKKQMRKSTFLKRQIRFENKKKTNQLRHQQRDNRIFYLPSIWKTWVVRESRANTTEYILMNKNHLCHQYEELDRCVLLKIKIKLKMRKYFHVVLVAMYLFDVINVVE